MPLWQAELMEPPCQQFPVFLMHCEAGKALGRCPHVEQAQQVILAVTVFAQLCWACWATLKGARTALKGASDLKHLYPPGLLALCRIKCSSHLHCGNPMSCPDPSHLASARAMEVDSRRSTSMTTTAKPNIPPVFWIGSHQ